MKAQAVSRMRAALAVALVVASSFGTSHAADDARGHWAGDFSVPAFDGRTFAGAIHQGAYVVAGEFEWAAGVAARRVARWNGDAWEPLGEGLAERVACLSSGGNDLYAGMEFGSAAVMRFDGSSWAPVGDLPGRTTALLTEGTALYAAGGFARPGLEGAAYVVTWDGADWRPVGGGLGGFVRALTRFRGELHAAIAWSPIAESHVARFDGTT